MKRRKTFLLLLLLFSVVLGSCNNTSSSSSSEPSYSEVDRALQVYEEAVTAGYEGTYEEWLSLITGGPNYELLTGTSDPDLNIGLDGDTYINTSTWDFFKFHDGEWRKIGNIMDPNINRGPILLTGTNNPSNDEGYEGDAYLNTSTWDFFVKKNGVWVLVGNIKGQTGTTGPTGPAGPSGDKGDSGDKGEPGIDGKEVEFNVSDTHIQWRYVSDENEEWIDLIALDTLTGKAGSDGENGLPGSDGREVEFNVSDTHIQWRYVGETEYIDLIALSLLVGAAGTDGINGTDGSDGISVISATIEDRKSVV